MQLRTCVYRSYAPAFMIFYYYNSANEHRYVKLISIDRYTVTERS